MTFLSIWACLVILYLAFCVQRLTKRVAKLERELPNERQKVVGQRNHPFPGI